MPTLSELQNNYNAAVGAYNNAVAAQTVAETSMKDAHAAIGRCVDAKGKNHPLKGIHVPILGYKANPKDCSVADFIIKCKTDCCSKETCEGRINYYNSTVDAYNNAVSTVSGAQMTMEAAKTALQASPDYNVAQEEEIQSGKTMRVVWIIAGIVVVVIIAGYFVFKFLKRK